MGALKQPASEVVEGRPHSGSLINQSTAKLRGLHGAIPSCDERFSKRFRSILK